MKRHIDAHNRKILEKEEVPEDTRTCNCRRKEECPLNGNCLVKEIVYSAEVETTQNVMSYYGLTERTFKERYNQHQSDFRHAKHRYNTELSKYVHSLKDAGTDFKITWNVQSRAHTYKPGSNDVICASKRSWKFVWQTLRRRLTLAARWCRNVDTRESTRYKATSTTKDPLR